MSQEKSKIIVTGYPYAFPHYFRVFDYVSVEERYFFILPRTWKSKTTFKLRRERGFTKYLVNAWSYGRQSFLGGPFKGLLPALFFLVPYLRFRYGCKVIYSCLEPNLLSTLFNSLIARFWGVKNILFTWQNVKPEEYLSGFKLKFFLVITRLNLSLASGVICGNDKAREIILSYRPGLKTIVCPLSGVDVEQFKPDAAGDWRQRLNIEGRKVFLFYGALDERKGLDYLLEAFNAASVGNAVLIIAGAGSLKDKLRKKAQTLNLEERVIFIDWLPNNELPKLLAAADVFVYPSVPHRGWEEQFGYAMAEAESAGLPVISTRSGSIDEIVVDGVTGFLVEPGNSRALAQAMEKIFSENIMEMGEKARNHIVINFDHKVVAGKITQFLKSFA